MAPSPASCPPPCRVSLGSIALGPDGNIWFVDGDNNVVGRITPAGAVTEFSEPYLLGGGAQTIALGPDGAMYVIASGGGSGKPDWILRVTVGGHVTQLNAGQNPAGGFGTGPESITAGPDGAIWFTEFWTNRVGRLTPAGDLTEYAIPTGDSGPRGIVTGSDGNLWFVESTRFRPAIARITTAGVITEFPISDTPTDNTPFGIVSGPGGDLWFTRGATIGHISTQGTIGWISLPQGVQPGNLVAGPDGNIWFFDKHTGAMARLGVTGALREFGLPRRDSLVTGMAVGADGRIWFAEGAYAKLASIGVRVPEVSMSRRPPVFLDSSSKSVDVRNTGEATLAISSVRVTGVDASLFTKGSDTCTGATLAPDASCSVSLRYAAGGPAGIQSALLEISDNASASPQRLQLVAQPPRCVLPVLGGGDVNTLPSGERLDVAAAQVLDDSTGGFESMPNGVQSAITPALPGNTAGYFDRTSSRWLPIGGPAAVSPDGRSYAFVPLLPGMGTEVDVVDIASATKRALPVPAGFWGVVAFTAAGIYLNQGYEGIGPDLWLLNPETGAFTKVLSDGPVDTVDGSIAWMLFWNRADTLPNPSVVGGGYNTIRKRDLAGGQTVTWLYRPGTNLNVVGLLNRSPVISVYDGVTTMFWLVTAPNQGRRLDFPFDLGLNPSESFFGDSMGLWIGSDDGAYLWTPRTGSVLVTEQAARPADACA